jgi:hypothetical protein
MTTRIAKLFDAVVLGHPQLTLTILAGIFAFSAYYVRDFDLDASTDSLLLENDAALQTYRKISAQYETREYVFVVFNPDGDLFADNSLTAIRNMREDFLRLAGVESINSLIDVPLVKQGSGKLADVADEYQTLAEPGVDKDKARRELMESPVFNELIISKDGTTTAMQLNLSEDPEYARIKRERNRLLIKKYSPDFTEADRLELDRINYLYDIAKEQADARMHETLTEIRSTMDRYRDQGTLYLGGVPMIADDMISYVKDDLIIFGIGVFIFLIVMLSIIFRQPRWVVLPLLNSFVALILMMGLLGLIGWRVTVISSNFASLMLIMTLDMNVYLIVRYRQLQRDYPELGQFELVSRTCKKMVWPCLYTALTIQLGFGSLVFCDIKPVIDFGWMMTLGLLVSFLISFLMFPAILILLPKVPLRGNIGERVPFTAALAAITNKYGNHVIFITAGLLVLTVIGVFRLEVENSFVNYFGENTEIHRGLKLIDDKLGGTTGLELILTLDDTSAAVNELQDAEEDTDLDFDDLNAAFGEEEQDKSDYWFTSEKIDAIKKVHDYLEGIPAVGKVQSLAATIRVAEDLNAGQPFDAFEMAILYKRLPDALKEVMITPYVTIENDEARVSLRVKDSLRDLRRNELLEQIQADITGKLGIPEDKLQMTGLLVLYNNMLQSLYTSLIESLGVLMLGITIMLVVLFRSLTLAIICIIPNILVSVLILGILGLLGIPLDMMTITISSITMGIAVEYSIQYIYRFREEFATARGSYVDTMFYCHANIGRAIYYVAITLIVGFSIMVLSNFIPTITFGVFVAMSMFLALVASMTLLPKILLIWKPF